MHLLSLQLSTLGAARVLPTVERFLLTLVCCHHIPSEAQQQAALNVIGQGRAHNLTQSFICFTDPKLHAKTTANVSETRRTHITMASQCTSATPKQTPDAPLAKCVILGESGVGKSAIVKRLLSNRFDERVCATIVCSFQFKTLEVGEQQVRLQIWDTAGQERYRSVTPMFYRHAHCAVVVYDISDSRSFEQVPVCPMLDETVFQATSI